MVACTFFSCCGVRARGRENNGQAGSSGWGWYQRTERAKFRRVVVDAKGQRGILFVDVDDRNYKRKRAGRKRRNTCRDTWK